MTTITKTEDADDDDSNRLRWLSVIQVGPTFQKWR